jgi:hypothetical protein
VSERYKETLVAVDLLSYSAIDVSEEDLYESLSSSFTFFLEDI